MQWSRGRRSIKQQGLGLSTKSPSAADNLRRTAPAAVTWLFLFCHFLRTKAGAQLAVRIVLVVTVSPWTNVRLWHLDDKIFEQMLLRLYVPHQQGHVLARV
jgi:hypothetical protein